MPTDADILAELTDDERTWWRQSSGVSNRTTLTRLAHTRRELREAREALSGRTMWEAAEAEREACARLVDEFGHGGAVEHELCALASRIRAPRLRPEDAVTDGPTAIGAAMACVRDALAGRKWRTNDPIVADVAHRAASLAADHKAYRNKAREWREMHAEAAAERDRLAAQLREAQLSLEAARQDYDHAVEETRRECADAVERLRHKCIVEPCAPDTDPNHAVNQALIAAYAVVAVAAPALGIPPDKPGGRDDRSEFWDDVADEVEPAPAGESQ